MTLDDYKQEFEKLGKGSLFNVNKPFLEEMIALSERIVQVRKLVGKDFIRVHPIHKNRVQIPESEKWLLKLETQYKDMTLALNKIIGRVETAEEDPMEKWVNEYKSKLE